MQSPSSDYILLSVTHRFLQVSLCQLAVLGVSVQNRAELQVGPGLDPGSRLELEHSLQTVHAQTDLGRTRRAEMFCKAQHSQVPGLRSLGARCHISSSEDKIERNTNLAVLCFSYS